MSDEQREEIDILQSIYPDELEVHSDTSYSIHLRLETTSARQLLIEVDYPESYPEDTPPILRVTTEEIDEDEENERESEDRPKDPGYDFTAKDVERISQEVATCAQENLGMPSVFAIVSHIKDVAEEIYAEGVAAAEAEHLRKLELQEEKEQAKFRGTPVTKESFDKWFAKFIAEQGEQEPTEIHLSALTGKEIFERGIQGDSDVEDE